MREIQKDIILAGRKWRIRKFDALTGSYVAAKLMGKLGAILAGVASGGVSSEIAIATAISEALSSMNKAEFIELQSDALSVVGEVTVITEGGSEVVLPVRIASGAWGVKDLDTDLLTVMALVSHSLVFNVSPFFDGNALKSTLESFKWVGTLLSALTSTDTPTPQ
jgi:hypothetical protein